MLLRRGESVTLAYRLYTVVEHSRSLQFDPLAGYFCLHCLRESHVELLGFLLICSK